jgi:hypothetical protein
MTIAFKAALEAPAFDESPDPIATAPIAEALAPAIAAPLEAPIAIPPWPVAEGADVAFVPEPIEIGCVPVPALAKSPMAIDCAEVEVGTVAPASATPPTTKEVPPPVPS